ncbi:FecR family protein [Peristeroidobacter soli]|uniref:FecR family protein n=1 Tax=Peristeroidobacter soli TaxID=2497877 RepID=UPI00101D477D|nr:FecR domain-containing protein [Peristeroidobacter soli]
MVVQQKIDELLVIRASEWVDLLPTATPQQLHELEQWLSQSKRHVEEFLEVAAVEFALGGLDRERRHDVDALLSRITSNVTKLPVRRAPAPRSRWQTFAMAASVAALAILVSFLVWNPGTNERIYATEIGQFRTLQLADGSLVKMNADSQIEVALHRSSRDVHLLRGEATFKVAHDSARPFTVRTPAGTVQALGTEFNVRNRMNGGTTVALLEGRVRLASTTAELFLNAGQVAAIDHGGAIERRMDVKVEDEIGWQKHRLTFDNASLDEIVAEFNRHNPALRIRLEGVDGKQYRYAGVFDANDPNELADFLAHEPELTVERRDGEIVIRPKVAATH